MSHQPIPDSTVPFMGRHYVAYHKFDDWGEYNTANAEFDHWSNHPLSRLEKTIGHRIWVIGGKPAKPRMKYALLSYYTAEVVEPEDEGGFWVAGAGVGLAPPIGLSGRAWWDVLIKEQANFSFGLNELTNPLIIGSLLKLVDDRATKIAASI